MKNLLLIILILFSIGCTEPITRIPSDRILIEIAAKQDTTGEYKCNIVEHDDVCYFVNSSGDVVFAYNERKASDGFFISSLTSFIIGFLVCTGLSIATHM